MLKVNLNDPDQQEPGNSDRNLPTDSAEPAQPDQSSEASKPATAAVTDTEKTQPLANAAIAEEEQTVPIRREQPSYQETYEEDYYGSYDSSGSGAKKILFITVPLVIILAFLVVYFWSDLFGESGPDEQQVQNTEQLARERELKRQQIAAFDRFTGIDDTRNMQVSGLLNIVSVKPKNMRVSLLYVYDDIVRTEFYAQTRTPIGEMRKQLKSNNLIDQYKMSNAASLGKGGFLVDFSAKTNADTPVSFQANAVDTGQVFYTTAQIESMVAAAASAEKVTLKKIASDDAFLAYTVAGRETAMLGFLEQLRGQPMNAVIKKLSIARKSRTGLSATAMSGVIELEIAN
jgi:hypothetical protein